MFGISKKEIAEKIANKIITDLREKGSIDLPKIGKLVWTAGTEEVRFQQDPHLIDELEERE